MAAGGNVPELGGYDYDFTSRVPEDLECLVCHLTMKDPVQIVGCGHRLCNICMESLLRRPSPTCPADRQPLSRDKIFPDAACRRRILDLSVKCSYSGCSWAGELRAMEEHAGVCQKLLVKCPHKCGLRDIPREKLEVHVRDECPAIEVQCEYKNLGCKAVFPRLSAKSHSETQVERHLNLALHGLQTTQLQVNELVSLVKEQQRQIEQLKEKEKRLDNPPFVWKIPNFKTVYEKAVTGEQEVIFSEPFYLFRCGYRLKIKMRPNGGASNPQLNKKFKGKYLSLYIIVIPGDYDWMLPWPISEEISVTLIDQNPLQHLRENITKVINFGSGPVLRPLKGDDVSGVGIGTFVEQNVLPTRSYLFNDTVFIMVNKNNAQ
ncbi:TNF receptor-associated factor 4-like [Oculina patagonica]